MSNTTNHPRKYKTPAAAAAARRKYRAEYMRQLRADAAVVLPSILLDAEHADALRGYMKRHGVGVSDAIRAAILATAAKS